MRRFRFSIAGILGVVVFCAVAAAALREATDLWDNIVFTAALGLLAVSVLLTVHWTGRRRAYWLGFALVGSLYLAAGLVPGVGSRLLTTRGLYYLDAQIPGRNGTFTVTLDGGQSSNTAYAVRSLTLASDGRVLTDVLQGPVQVWSLGAGRLLFGPNGTTENFVRIGHSLLALALAHVGGLFSRRLAEGGRNGGEGA
jgi:hypothetical protein